MPDGTSGVLDRRRAGTLLEALLRDPNVLLIGHNVAFDFAVMLRAFPHLTSLVWRAYAADRVTDTGLRQKLLDLHRGEMDHPQRPSKHRYGEGKKKSAYSLAALVHRHLGEHLDKGADTWRMRYAELLNVPISEWPAEALSYPAKDAQATLSVFEAQSRDELAQAGRVSPDEYRQARHAWWLQLMSVWGFATDVPRVLRLESTVQAELEAKRKELVAHKLLREEKKKGTIVYVRDQKQAREFMRQACEAEGRDLKLTDKGAIALNIEACEHSSHPVLKAYADYTHLATILTKDIAALRGGVVHAGFNSLLETGRTSAFGNADTGGYNVQNPARKGGVRECFISRPGNVLVDADYGGLELCTMSQACLWLLGRSSLAQAINEGKDPHLLMAANIVGCSYEEALARYKAHGLWKAGDPRGVRDDEIAEARQISKPLNFGLPGGMSARTFVDYCAAQKIALAPTRPDAETKAYRLKALWQQTWPEFPEAYFPRHAAMTEQGDAEYVALLSGRVRGGCDYTTLNNGYFQSLGADCAKDALWEISWRCHDPEKGSVLLGSHPVDFVHDQALVESPEEIAAECAEEVGHIMNETGKKWMPDVPPRTVPCLARCWSKNAVDVRDASGRLQVWEERKAT
jgi:DNA polymerase I-like protein with 3'-5' exonuclease and polymerase domains